MRRSRRAYARLYIHPKMTASPPKPEWFTENFIANDHVKLFASDVLGLCPLLLAFLQDRCSGRVPADHVRCFELLTFMLGLLSGEDDMTGALHAVLAGVIAEHAVLFRRLYSKFIKVKFHHLVHVPDDLLRLGKVISCFAPERKHKDVKASEELLVEAGRGEEELPWREGSHPESACFTRSQAKELRARAF